MIHIDADTVICHKIPQIFQNSEKVTAKEANAETALLDLKIRFKCFCFSLSINHNFEKLRENPRLINGKVHSNFFPPLLHKILILYIQLYCNY